MTGDMTQEKVWTVPRHAIGAQTAAGEVAVRLVEVLPDNGALRVKLRDADVAWERDRAWIVATPGVAEEILPGLAEFAGIEDELRSLEEEIEAAWPGLEENRSVVFDATAADLKRSAILDVRVGATFGRRIRLARLESHVIARRKRLAPGAVRLVEKLLEAAEAEARIEVLDGQCEVFEHIYEMVSQRLGEFRASRQTERVEWIIIALLAAELLLMLLRRG